MTTGGVIDARASAGSAPAEELRHLPAATRRRLSDFSAGDGPSSQPSDAKAGSQRGEGQEPYASSGHNGTAHTIAQALAASRGPLAAVVIFSLVLNILMLATPLFMLQVYDRVLASGSMPTLMALTLLTAGVLAMGALLDITRSRVLVRIARDIDVLMGRRVLDATIARQLRGGPEATSGPKELDHVRQMIAGPALLAVLDAPWTPIYLVVVAAFHPWLGITALAGAAVLLALGWAAEWRSRRPLGAALLATAESAAIADAAERNAQVLTALGMRAGLIERWQRAHTRALALQALAADRLATVSALAKAARMLLQIAMLAVGAALAVGGEISAGVIVAASIMMGRALAPLEQAVGQWRTIARGREALRRLGALLDGASACELKLSLPAPRGHLTVNNLAVDAPLTGRRIIEGLHFSLAPGQVLAIVGPSGSGKSTLARALVGVWPIAAGEIRLDGARLAEWASEALGRHIGYLPQEVELFAGNVRDNIARFDPTVTDEEVLATAMAARAHQLILDLPKGYGSEIGPYGAHLSAGQRQRVALARALLRNPALVVLDEPNANLDREGEEALSAAIDGLRRRGRTVVIVSHRPQAIARADFLLVLEKGRQRAFGPRSEVIAWLNAGTQAGGEASGSVRAGREARP